LGVQKGIKPGGRIGQRDIVDTVFNLSAIAIVLPFDAGCFTPTLGCSGFINEANRFIAGVLGGSLLLRGK